MEIQDFLQIVHTRRSVRKFTQEAVSEKDIATILHAAMSSPTARNEQSWRFIVINDRALLDAMPDLSPYMTPALSAPLAILVCGDLEGGKSAQFWEQDCSAAIQTMLLTARALGLGSLWCGIHPVEEREQAFVKQFGLPGTVRPLGLVILGHPDQNFNFEDRFDADKVHYNHW